MDINRKNYEIYFMDYLDGNLTGLQVAELMVFLAENPDLEQELNELKSFGIDVPVIEFSDKNKLKKFDFSADVTKQNFNEFTIAFFENDLTADQKTRLEQFLLLNPLMQKEFDLIASLRLKPDYSIVFEDKSLLRKSKTIVFNFRKTAIYISSAAAAVILVFLISSVLPSFMKNETESGKAVSGTRAIKLPEIEIMDKTFGNDGDVQVAVDNNLRHYKIRKNRQFVKENITVDTVQQQNSNLANESSTPDTLKKLTIEKENIAEEKIIYPIEERDSVTNPKNEIKDPIAMNTDAKTKKFSLWKTLETGVNTISGLAGGRKIIDNEYNEDGSVKKVEINTRLFAYKSN